MSSSHLPKNAEIEFVDGHKSGVAEIFWQTQNAVHVLETYSEVVPRGTIRTHDLKFNEISVMLQGKTIWIRTKRKPPFVVLARRGIKIYQVCISLAERKDAKDKIFAVIVSCCLCINPVYVRLFKENENDN
jgi:hypothetical protein